MITMDRSWARLVGAGVFVAVVVLFWSATQSVAATYGYHSALGPPLTKLGAANIYGPWAVLVWAVKFGRSAPGAFVAAFGTAALHALLAGAFAAGLLWRATGTKSSDTHGTARWATDAELKRAGLLGEEGVVLCQTHDAVLVDGPNGGKRQKRAGRLVRHNGPEHLIIFAPTRSGKGVSVCLPTMLTWPGSVMAWDVKKELWNLTSGCRSGKLGTDCIRFEPTDLTSARFNPLLEVRKGEATEVRDAQAIAEMLVDPDGGKEWDHWQKASFSLLTATILHVLYAEADKSLAGVARFLADPKRTQFDTLDRMLNTKHRGVGPHPAIEEAAREMLNKADNELSGVMATATAALGLYRDPVVARATSGSDFRIDELMRGDRPKSLYLVIAPSDIDRLRPLMRLVVSQIAKRLTESNVSGGGAAYKHRMLFMMDEFPTLGKLKDFATGMAYWAGYGIKALLITQDLNQLEERYGEKNSILSNCHVRLTFTANDDHTADRISKLLGQSTRVTESVSHSGQAGLGGLFGTKQQSKGTQETARPLLTPGEILQLSTNEALLFIGGTPPYRGKKVLYYENPVLKEWAALPALTPKEEAYYREQDARKRGGAARGDWEDPPAAAGASR